MKERIQLPFIPITAKTVNFTAWTFVQLLKERRNISLKVPLLNVTMQAVNFTATQGKKAALFQALDCKSS